jgi:hypothetical protein
MGGPAMTEDNVIENCLTIEHWLDMEKKHIDAVLEVFLTLPGRENAEM